MKRPCEHPEHLAETITPAVRTTASTPRIFRLDGSRVVPVDPRELARLAARRRDAARLTFDQVDDLERATTPGGGIV